MIHSADLRVAIISAAITVASAYTTSANASFLLTGRSIGSAAVWASPGSDDDASIAMATGDFNRDGIADFVEVTAGEDSSQHFLTVLLGQSDGTFKTVASRNLIGNDPRALVVGDFNGDGAPDVIVGDGDGKIVEFLGDGKGNMVAAGEIAAVASVASITIGRFTRNGHLDLAVSDAGSNSVQIFLGADDGSFRSSWSFQLPRVGGAFLLATADFNGDGIADLVISDNEDENYEVMLGNGLGTFSYAPELSHLKDPNSYCPT